MLISHGKAICFKLTCALIVERFTPLNNLGAAALLKLGGMAIGCSNNCTFIGSFYAVLKTAFFPVFQLPANVHWSRKAKWQQTMT